MSDQGPARSRFTADTVSDQKRLARGEQLLHARTLLRERDHAHNKKWRVLMLAGGSPAGEITAIRELMPLAHITAVDRDPSCLAAAIDAGADEVVCCDLGDFARTKNHHRTPNIALTSAGRFDIVHLDFCGVVTPEMERVVSMNARLVASGGVYIVAFSYGRDVVEVFMATRRLQCIPDEVPDNVAQRITWLIGHSSALRSIITYRGAAMPMCSVLMGGSRAYWFNSNQPVSYVALQPGDFEVAVTCPDPSKLYDCPQERIESLRRSHAAVRASYTRGQRKLACSK